MKRITNRDLERVVEAINLITGQSFTAYQQTPSGLKAQVGNYHVSFAYGGAALHQIVSDGGATRDVLETGHISKRDLLNRLNAFRNGLESK